MKDTLMKTTLLFLALMALPSQAQRPYELGSDGPGGYCYFDGFSWHCTPQAVPEPGSPALLVGLASAVVLINQRRRTP